MSRKDFFFLFLKYFVGGSDVEQFCFVENVKVIKNQICNKIFLFLLLFVVFKSAEETKKQKQKIK